jgi:hypothetical protein
MDRDNLGRPIYNKYGNKIEYGMPKGESGPGFQYRLHGTITEQSAYITKDGVKVGKITERMNDATETEYIIWVDWKAYIESGIDDGITGIDMDEYPREYYIRDHMPYFMKMRVIPDSREDLRFYLEKCGMTDYDKWEFMMRTKGESGPDPFRVERID